MSSTILEFKNYSITYDDGKILEFEDAEIFEGEFIGIMGRSGCGKTSLLNSLFSLNFCGVIKYEKCQLLGQDLKLSSSEKYSYISYMPQFSQDALNPKITIEEYIKLTLKGNNLDFDLSKIIEVLNALSLPEEVMKKYPYELSGGMKQRLILMLSYIKKPQLLILDEPSSALDFITLKIIMDFLILIENTLTIVIVSHNKGFLQNVCHRVIYI
ncbi:ATP-binding cassette domain-containing protein [Clostridium sp. CF012]|uniref:ATP-binding cassette domain-containing protein n=1 Tax=Clostridium sp. CF012 TaxID=2843319 RepID=UPI001C0E2911|nr:ATP-binding cassette domain-containing protein [Clostridium sp. CF012]MBU3145780.1 ATP-binding cassette domain-containing protein [Clostridium sp. CF012]